MSGRRVSPQTWLALTCLISVCTLGRVQAVEPAPPPVAPRLVVVSPPTCPIGVFPTAAFLDCLRVELAGRGLSCCTSVETRDPPPAGTSVFLQVELPSCAAGVDPVQVSVRDVATARIVAHAVSLGDVAETARPRALALAAAELIRSVTQVDAAPAATAVAPVAGPPAPRVQEPPASRVDEPPAPRELTLHVEAETRAAPSRDTRIWGGRAGVSAHRRRLHVDLDAAAGYGQAPVTLGTIVLKSATVGLGFGPRLTTRTMALELGLRADLGRAWVHGESSGARVVTSSGSRLISSVGLRGSVEFPARFRVHPYLGLEAGLMARGLAAQANGDTVAGLTGYYWLAALGVAATP